MRFTNLAKTVRKVSGQAGEVAGGYGVRIWELDQGRRNGVRFRGRQANFYVTGADMGNPVAEQSESGGGVYDG